MGTEHSAAAALLQYHIFRRSPQTGQPFDPEVDTPVAVVNHPTTAYEDKDLPAGEYDTQVFAWNGSRWSVGSSVVQFATAAPGTAAEDLVETLISITRELRFTPPTGPDGSWLLEVLDDEGKSIGMTADDSWRKALWGMRNKIDPSLQERDD